eukprot:TRINITY_DN16681_c0_g1_i1.p1 TRINITY_DN16681_c0_g1~~TRINITY_DN16681_c0_g1_i1.p1  ORF type:complete len:275 (+),score=17.26 TRINITY_DN16681_c0_g1_i1:65-826(+)
MAKTKSDVVSKRKLQKKPAAKEKRPLAKGIIRRTRLPARTATNQRWTASEERVLSKLRTPEQIQRFVDALPFDPKDRTFSVRQVLQQKIGDCFSCGLLAAYCLSRLGYPPLLIGMECDPAVDEPGHIIVPYRHDGLWGAISKSNYTGIRGRDPVYASVRELIMSYFEFLVNKDGVKVLRTYSDPFNLDKVDPTQDWVWRTDIESGGQHIEKFSDICPRKCLPKGFRKARLSKMRGTTLKGQLLGANRAGLIYR